MMGDGVAGNLTLHQPHLFYISVTVEHRLTVVTVNLEHRLLTLYLSQPHVIACFLHILYCREIKQRDRQRGIYILTKIILHLTRERRTESIRRQILVISRGYPSTNRDRGPQPSACNFIVKARDSEIILRLQSSS